MYDHGSVVDERSAGPATGLTAAARSWRTGEGGRTGSEAAPYSQGGRRCGGC